MKDLDTLLRDDARAALPDDGFTARVLRALPSHRAPSPWLRAALTVGSGFLGSVLAVALAPAELDLLQGFADLARLRGWTPAAFLGAGMGAALLLSALVLAADPD